MSLDYLELVMLVLLIQSSNQGRLDSDQQHHETFLVRGLSDEVLCIAHLR